MGQVVSLALFTGIDSEVVALFCLTFQLLLCRFSCGVEVLALTVAVSAATLVWPAVHWCQVPEPAAVTLVWKEVNATFLFLVAGGLYGLYLRTVDTLGLSIFSKAGGAFSCHILLLKNLIVRRSTHLADLPQPILRLYSSKT